MTRIQRALFVRDMALGLLAQFGRFEETNIGPVLTAQVGQFQFLHRTPFQRTTWSAIQRSDAKAGMPERLRCKPFGLDAWHNHRRFLSMDWEDLASPRLTSFRNGDWEAQLGWLCGLTADSASFNTPVGWNAAIARDRPMGSKAISTARH